MIIDRASSFSDPEIIETLKSKFVNVALDQWYPRKQQDAEGEYYRSIAKQGPCKDMNSTTQGLYACTADGKLLGFTNNRTPDRVKDMLRRALAGFHPEEAKAVTGAGADPIYARKVPEGGLLITVTSRVLGGYPAPRNAEVRRMQESLGRDNLWVRADEHAALVKGVFPDSLRRRIVYYHLMDNTRGEPPFWRAEEVKKAEIKLSRGRITGAVHLETAGNDRGYQPELLGVVEAKDGKITRFDAVAKGLYWGEGGATPDAPPGKFPFAVAFTLSAGKDEVDRVPPQGTKDWLPTYLNP